MKEFYCFNIEFPNAEFDQYYINSEKVSPLHHAHLYASADEIELRIFYKGNTLFGGKFSMWSSKINWRKFGTYTKVSNEQQNDRIQRIDLSAAGMLGVKVSSTFHEDGFDYIQLKINSVKFYWRPVIEKTNTAEFYLSEAGFRIVNDYYSTLYGTEGDFNISRMSDRGNYYNLGKSKFRPEFNFYLKDSKESIEAKIIKEPKIQFHYNDDVTEEEAIYYGEVVRRLASFFFHLEINFTLRRIHLPKHTITIKNLHEKNPQVISGNLFAFKIHVDFHNFLLKNWESKVLENSKKVFKTIELFVQSLLVDDSSRFLIRFNIIELCNDSKQSVEKFTEILPKKEKLKKYDQALRILTETIKPEEHREFIEKWRSVSGNLSKKPMIHPLVQFFESQNLVPSQFPIKVKELIELRNNITHGSIENVNPDKLTKANLFLYRLTGILILNLLGIDDWILNTDLTE